jgi:hypothetical protein
VIHPRNAIASTRSFAPTPIAGMSIASSSCGVAVPQRVHQLFTGNTDVTRGFDLIDDCGFERR